MSAPLTSKCPNYDPNTREAVRPGGSCREYNTSRGCPHAHPWQPEWDGASNNSRPFTLFNLATQAAGNNAAPVTPSTPQTSSNPQPQPRPQLRTPQRSRTGTNASTNTHTRNSSSGNQAIEVMELDSDSGDDRNTKFNKSGKSDGSDSSVQFVAGPIPTPVQTPKSKPILKAKSGRHIRSGVSGISAASGISVPDSSATFVTARSENSALSAVSVGSVKAPSNMSETAEPIEFVTVESPENLPLDILEEIASATPRALHQPPQEKEAVEHFLHHLLRTLHHFHRTKETQSSLNSYNTLFKSYDSLTYGRNRVGLMNLLAPETRDAWVTGKEDLNEQITFSSGSAKEWMERLIELDGTAETSETAEREKPNALEKPDIGDTGGDSKMEDIGTSQEATPKALVKVVSESGSQPERSREMAEALRRWRGRLQRGVMGERLGALRLEFEETVKAHRSTPYLVMSKGMSGTTGESESELTSEEEMESLPDEKAEIDATSDEDIEMDSSPPTPLTSYERSLVRMLDARIIDLDTDLDPPEEWATRSDDGFESEMKAAVNKITKIYVGERIQEREGRRSEPLQDRPGEKVETTSRQRIRDMGRAQEEYNNIKTSSGILSRLFEAPVDYDLDRAKMQLTKLQSENSVLQSRGNHLTRVLQELETRRNQASAAVASASASAEGSTLPMEDLIVRAAEAQVKWVQQSPELQASAQRSNTSSSEGFEKYSNAPTEAAAIYRDQWTRTYEDLKREALELIEPIAKRTEDQLRRLEVDKEQYLRQTKQNDLQGPSGGNSGGSHFRNHNGLP